jgi:NADPH:quinone reductase-like Zn-dependent oxidoreductase
MTSRVIVVRLLISRTRRIGRRGLMQAGETAEPTVEDHDALVAIHAAGVNILDAKIRDGEFKLFLPCTTPFVLGHDLPASSPTSARP